MVRTITNTVFPDRNEKSSSSGQGELCPVPAARVELSPLIEGCHPRCEHDVVCFKEAEPAGPGGGVVAGQLLLQQVPGDGELGAFSPEAVDVPAQGCPLLLLVLLLHVVDMPIVTLPEGAERQPGVGLLVVAVARVDGGDRGFVHHSWRLALARQGAAWLVLAAAAFGHLWGWSALCDHLAVVLGQDLGHVGHRPVAHLDGVLVEGAS